MAKEAAGGDLGRVGDAKPVLQASALPAEYALLAHSMPGIAGSAQINQSGVLPGDPPALVSGCSAGVSSSLASHSYSAISVSALRGVAEAGIAVEAIAFSGAALCERRLVADSVRWAV